MEVNELYCIGSNKYGQAGAGKKYHNYCFKQPKPIVFPIFAKQVTCGAHHSALLTIDGHVYAMGSNINGALAIPSAALNYSYSPILIEGLKDVCKISSGYNHMTAIIDGTLFSWGKGIDGQLGIGKYSNAYSPQKVKTLGKDVDDVICGSNHTIVKMSNGKCYSFGNGIYGQLGVGNNKNACEPVKVNLDQSVDEVAAGQNFSLFLINNTVYGVGDNSFGQIDATIKKKCILDPIKISQVSNISTITAGKFSAALTLKGEVLIWGVPKQQGIIRVSSINQEITDIGVGGHSIFCLTAEGNIYSYKFNDQRLEQSSICPNRIQLPTNTILGFSVGESHAIVIGDICGEVPAMDETQKVLQVLNEGDSMNSSKLSKITTKRDLNQQQEISEEASISVQHCAKTPSSIRRQQSNFLKAEQQNIGVRNFDKQVKQKGDKDHYLKKIESVMKLLQENKRLEQNQTYEAPLSRRHTRSRLQIVNNKENRIPTNRTQKYGQQNKELILELREKELKISQLQQKLSRKQVEIETQRQLIELLTKVNQKNE